MYQVYAPLPYIIDLILFPFLVSPSGLLAAKIVLSILSHLRSSHVPVFGVATASTLTFCKVGCFVDIADVQVHSTIDNYVAMIDEVHCKAIVKEAMMPTIAAMCHGLNRLTFTYLRR